MIDLLASLSVFRDLHEPDLHGSLPKLRRTAVHVRFGSLTHVEPGEKTAAQLRRDADRIMEAIAAMRPPAYRGVYTDAIKPFKSPRADAAAAR